jgi:hypothetical protein
MCQTTKRFEGNYLLWFAAVANAIEIDRRVGLIRATADKALVAFRYHPTHDH